MFEYFRHQIIKNVTVGFGTLFNDMYIGRYDASSKEVNRIKVPLAYGPKQKYLVRLEQASPDLTHNVEMTLPRMSYELQNIAYDPSRKQPTALKIVDRTVGSTLDYRYERVPYILSYNLNIMTKNTEDAFQILEQILPYFTPDYCITFKSFPVDPRIDVPISIGNISFNEDYTDNWEDRKVCVITITFDAKIYVYGPVRNSGVILEATAHLINFDSLFATGLTTSPQTGLEYEYVTGATGLTFADIIVSVTGGATAGSVGITGNTNTIIREYH